MSSSDHIVADVVRGLYEGRYVPGQKLTESDLSRRYRVGRGTVREALRRLEAERIVTVSPHKGASIRELTRRDVQDILEVIERLSGLAVRLAAERITTTGADVGLRETLAELTRVARWGDEYQLALIRDRFYSELARAGGNNELARLTAMIHPHLIRMQFRSTYAMDSERNLVEYRRVIEAVLAGDARRAERDMRRHISSIARSIEHLPDSSFAPGEGQRAG